jgi:hypothetical protein
MRICDSMPSSPEQTANYLCLRAALRPFCPFSRIIKTKEMFILAKYSHFRVMSVDGFHTLFLPPIQPCIFSREDRNPPLYQIAPTFDLPDEQNSV